MKNYWLNRIESKKSSRGIQTIASSDHKIEMKDTFGLGKMGYLIKKKFRWMVGAKKGGEMLFEHFAKVNARPNLKIEEVEFNTGDYKTWIPGKQEWNLIIVNINFGITEDEYKKINESASEADEIELRLLDGLGQPLEVWSLTGLETLHCEKIDSYVYDEDFPDVEMTIKNKDAEYKTPLP